MQGMIAFHSLLHTSCTCIFNSLFAWQVNPWNWCCGSYTITYHNYWIYKNVSDESSHKPHLLITAHSDMYMYVLWPAMLCIHVMYIHDDDELLNYLGLVSLWSLLKIYRLSNNTFHSKTKLQLVYRQLSL